MLYLTASDIYALINYVGFATVSFEDDLISLDAIFQNQFFIPFSFVLSGCQSVLLFFVCQCKLSLV